MKRQHWQMKEEILDALESFPHNLSQITKRLETNRDTAERHLEELESYGKVRESTEWVNGNKKNVWRLNK